MKRALAGGVLALAMLVARPAGAQERPIDVLTLTSEAFVPHRDLVAPRVDLLAPQPKPVRLSSGATAAIIVGAVCVTVLIVAGVFVLGRDDRPHAPRPPRP